MIELDTIKKDGYINDKQFELIESNESNKLFSLHWELRMILYVGVVLLSSGISVFVYKNIDTIGHQAILLLIAIICAVCFYYINKFKLPYVNEQVNHPSPFFDYVTLFGCLLFWVFIGYIQYQYHLFSIYYYIWILAASVFSFYVAYRYDHKGVLSIAISGLASAIGLVVTPSNFMIDNDFSSWSIIFSTVMLGFFIGVWGWYSDFKKIKQHFVFTYNNFSLNLMSIGFLAALFNYSFKLISLLLLLIVCFYFIKYAIIKTSYLFLLLSVLYGYIGISYSLFYFMMRNNTMSDGLFFFAMLYVILSAIGVIFFFINIKKIITINK